MKLAFITAALAVLAAFPFDAIAQSKPDNEAATSFSKGVKLFKAEKYDETKRGLSQLVQTGRLPITEQNIEIILEESDMPEKKLINERSSKAALTMIGLKREGLKHSWESILTGYDNIGTVLFVTSHDQKDIT